MAASKDDLLNMQAMYEQAVELHSAGKPEKAVPLYAAIVREARDADTVYYNLGLAWYELGEFAKAKDAFEHALALQDKDADYWFNLGVTCKQLELYLEAALAYRRALDRRPDDPDILFNLGRCMQDSGALDEAVRVYEHLLALDSTCIPALNNLAYIHHLRGSLRQAEPLYRRLVSLNPTNKAANYMLKAIQSRQVHAPPEEYIRVLFDHYAEEFEQNLLCDLDYQVPKKILEVVEKNQQKRRFEHILDIGCGTGLCGVLFRDRCQHLSGVDLSPKMLALAGQKRVYDRLYEAELVAHLQENDATYDLLLAADVFSYLGDLQPAMAALRQRCQPSGLICFSVEVGEADWEIQATGRFSHSQGYIRQLATREGWTVEHCSIMPIRKEGVGWIQGAIFLFS
ncbi:MAG: hypothetical protein CSA33_03605 [Desulfobulbus propionicus]|nr:MAG: hypothetical protein CSA33_03605 [Desulfobulbus propionicus]